MFAESVAVRTDKLGRTSLVKALSDLITHPSNNEHFTVGLLGHWGVGKSSVLTLLGDDLRTQDHIQVLFGTFNAWVYEHCGNLQAGLAQEAISALSSPFLSNPKGFFGKAKRALANKLARLALVVKFAFALHGWRAAWLAAQVSAAMGGAIWGVYKSWPGVGKALSGGDASLPAIMSQPLPLLSIAGAMAFLALLKKPVSEVLAQARTKELRTYLKLPDYQKDLGTLPVMQKQIRKLCAVRLGDGKVPKRSKERRFVFVVDDLDRCEPEGIVKTFEAVRLVMDIPRVTVIIAVDQRVALAALALHYKDLATYRNGESPLCIARDYLAKVLHLPLRLENPDEESSKQYLHHLWNKKDWLEYGTLGTTPSRNSVEGTQQADAFSPTASEHAPESRTLSGREVVDLVLSNSAELPKPSVEELGLSDAQMFAYYHWTREYKLRNPRQMKRLLNSYNLIRLLLRKVTDGPNDDPKTDGFVVIGGVRVPVFPVMLALVILEYLYDIPIFEKRDSLRKSLLGAGTENNCWKHGELGHLARGAKRFGLCDPNATDDIAAQAMLEFVDPYVMPALERA